MHLRQFDLKNKLNQKLSILLDFLETLNTGLELPRSGAVAFDILILNELSSLYPRTDCPARQFQFTVFSLFYAETNNRIISHVTTTNH